jgi:ATP-dependent DNA helicase RecG
MLLFGEGRERYLPDAWIQAGRFHGVDKSRIVDGTEIRAHSIRAVEEAIAFVEKHALHGADIAVSDVASAGAFRQLRSARRW